MVIWLIYIDCYNSITKLKWKQNNHSIVYVSKIQNKIMFLERKYFEIVENGIFQKKTVTAPRGWSKSSRGYAKI